MNKPPVRVVRRDQLSDDTPQTPGLLREVDHDRIGVRTGDNPDGRALGGCVDLLMHRVRGNENEVSRTRLSDVLQTVTPPIPGGAFKHIQDCLLIAVVVRTGRCAG